MFRRCSNTILMLDPRNCGNCSAEMEELFKTIMENFEREPIILVMDKSDARGVWNSTDHSLMKFVTVIKLFKQFSN